MTRRQTSQSGSVFTILMAGIAIAAALGVVLYQTISGPMSSMVRITNKTQAKAQMQSIASIIIMDAVNNMPNNGDCSGTGVGMVVPRSWKPGTAPTGGGILPTTIGAPLTDPWGTNYGYCTWEVGVASLPSGSGCDLVNGYNQTCTGISNGNTCSGGTSPNVNTGYNALRLLGSINPTVGSASSQTVFAIISAGPNRTFNSTCSAYVNTSSTLVTPGGDDIVVSYTYQQAATATSSLWTLSPSSAATAVISKDISVGTTLGTVPAAVSSTYSNGIINGAAVVAEGEITSTAGAIGLANVLGSSTQLSSGNCNAGSLGQMYYNTTTNLIDVCTCAGGSCPATGTYSWAPLVTGSGGAALNTITAAANTNTIDSTTFGSQIWNWSGLVTGTALTLADTDASATTATTLAVNNAATTTGNALAATISGASNTGNAVYGINSGTTNTGAGGYFTNTGGGYALITGSGNVGIGTAAPASPLQIGSSLLSTSDYSTTTPQQVEINNLYTGTANVKDAAVMILSQAGAASNSTENDAGLIIDVLIPSGQTVNYGQKFGLRDNVEDLGSGAVTNMTGGLFSALFGGSSTAANIYGTESFAENTSTGTVTNAYAVQALLTNAGTITNGYGVYITGAGSGGTWTNKPFDLYAADSAAYNYFAGNVGIGATTPGAPLEVRSTSAAYASNAGGLALTTAVSTGGLRFGVLDSSYSWISSFNSLPLVLNAGGNNVGIGTASPGATLEVNGAVQNDSTVTTATSTTTPIIYGGTAAGSTLTLDGTSNGSPSSAYVLLNPSGQGSVGIGTTTPASPLQIGSSLLSTSDYSTTTPQQVEINNLYTGTANVKDAAVMILSQAGAASNSTENDAGLIIDVLIPSGQTVNYGQKFGLRDNVEDLGSGAVTNMTGGLFSALFGSSSTAANIYGTESFAENTSTGTVTNAYAVQALLTNAGTITNGYGVYITGAGSGGTWTNKPFDLYAADSGAYNYFAGNVGIATASPSSYTLQVNGSVAGTSAYNNTSDARLKKDVAEIPDGLDLVEKLRGVRFNWRKPEERKIGKDLKLPVTTPQVGFIAQEVQKVLPEAVMQGSDGIYTMQESKIAPILVEAMKELKSMFDGDHGDIAKLKADNDNEAAQIKALTARLAALEAAHH